MPNKNLYFYVLIIIFFTHTNTLFCADNKKSKSTISRLTSIIWSASKISLGCYALWKGLNNQFTQERDSYIDTDYKYPNPTGTLTREFMDTVFDEQSFNLINPITTIADYNKNIFKILTYWKKSDYLTFPLLGSMSVILIISGIHDLYHLFKVDDETKKID